MGRPLDPLPPGERCEACAYVLDGLPIRGKCPECGTRYAFEFLYKRKALSAEQCNGCDYSLKGLPLRGVCPECGMSYWYDRPRNARPTPSLGDWWSNLIRSLPSPRMGVAITLLVLGALAVLAYIAWRAFSRFEDLIPRGW